MRVEVYQCDGCGAGRTVVNHWFLVTFGDRNLMIEPWEGASRSEVEGADLHLCGAECVGKVTDAFLNGKKWATVVRSQPLAIVAK